MEGNSKDSEVLIARIQQLEHERAELQKDIEQLCMQQAGPAYLGVATRMHFQRTAGLEQEIESLQKKLTACVRENKNLQEELSEADHIKSQLAELHSAEVAKNIEAEKQLKFFQGTVASAFAERDNAVMEAEKVKEKEEFLSQELDTFRRRVEELTSELLEERKLKAILQSDLEDKEEQNKVFRKVIDKFYDIRQLSSEDLKETRYEDKCKCLLHDSAEMWSFHDQSGTSSIQSALEEEVKTLRSTVDNLQNKLQMGLEIENHLKKQVCDLRRETILSEEKIKKGISALLHYHSQQRVYIKNLLDEEYAYIQSTIDMVEEKIRLFQMTGEENIKSHHVEDSELPESECRDVHVNAEVGPDLSSEKNDTVLPTTVPTGSSNVSEVLSQALQEKVAALLLLSQQEERYLLERNVHAALQKKMEELQRNLLQVTNEKVKVLMELAQLRQDYQILKEKFSLEKKQEKPMAEAEAEAEGKKFVQEGDGRLKNLLKKSYLRRWVGISDSEQNDAGASLNVDIARVKIENATLRESLAGLKHLTCSVRRLRLSLFKVQESLRLEGTKVNMPVALDKIVNEAKLLKTALGSSLPISWSAETDVESCSDNLEVLDSVADGSSEKIDFISAGGFEMVELLIFAAYVLKDCITG